MKYAASSSDRGMSALASLLFVCMCVYACSDWYSCCELRVVFIFEKGG